MINWTDIGINAFVLQEVEKESERQIEKWGLQTHTPFEWLAILTEEVGELNKSIVDCYLIGDKFRKATFKEAIQVATLALKIAEMSLK